MIRFFLVFFLVVAPFGADASPDSLFVQGNAAYTAGNYQEARKAWESILSDGKESPELFLNLGNACFRLKDFGWARFYYEKSLSLDPINGDAQSNLDLVQSYLQDKITVLPQTNLKMSFLSGFGFLKMTVTVLLLILVSLVTAGMVYLNWMNRFTGIKKYLYLSVLTFTLIFQTVSAGYFLLDSTTRAGVLLTASAARSQPADNGPALFSLHAGARLFAENEHEGWVLVRLENGNSGWMPSKVVGLLK